MGAGLGRNMEVIFPRFSRTPVGAAPGAARGCGLAPKAELLLTGRLPLDCWPVGAATCVGALRLHVGFWAPPAGAWFPAGMKLCIWLAR